jgi:hypothetical protein
MNQKWVKGCNADADTKKNRTGIAWPKAGIWKLSGIRRGSERGRCPISLGQEDAKYIQPNVMKRKVEIIIYMQ